MDHSYSMEPLAAASSLQKFGSNFERRPGRLLAILCLLPFLHSCATKEIPKGRESNSVVSVIAIAVDPERKRRDWPSVPQYMVAIFPSIPGAIYGDPVMGGEMRARVFQDAPFELDVTELQKHLANSATAPTDKFLQTVVIEPRITKIARAGTFLFDGLTGTPIGGAGFADEQTKETMIAVYFDRACTLRGTLFSRNGDPVDLSLVIPAAGVHWIRAMGVEGKDQHYLLVPTPKNLEFRVVFR